MPMQFRILAFAMLNCAALAADTSHKIGVEVWVRGSDIETPRHNATISLRDSVERAIAHSARFSLARANEGTVRVMIPSDVVMASDPADKFILFEAQITTINDKDAHVFSGFCGADEIEKCAAQIVAEIAVLHKSR